LPSGRRHGTLSAVSAPRKAAARHGNLLFVGGLLVASGTAVLATRGTASFLHALDVAWGLFLTVLPSLGAGVLLAGFLQGLLPREMVTRRMGAQSGMVGLLLATLAGFLTPGGPMASFPMVMVLAVAGADRGALIAYISAWSLLGFQRTLVWEIPVLGADFAILRLLVCLPLPLLAGLLARRMPLSLVLPQRPPSRGPGPLA
jgi:uncharacterized membrane protein YraQ (UPF0718 family)